MSQHAPIQEARKPLEGSVLGGYRIGARLGSGGAAAVYLGLRDGPGGTEFAAIKLIHEHLADEREFVHMFRDEARIALLLAHPNIVRTHALGQDGDRLFLAMEYLEGQSMHQVFVRGTRHGARLPLDLVAWVGASVARALHYAHTLSGDDGNPLKLVHRDVSPRNIFITYDGVPKLIDFGIAHAVGRIAKTSVGQMKGTFSYIAPERALGGGCDHRADVFSLAVTLFEAGTGRRLFKGDDDVETLRNVLRGDVPDPRDVRPGFPDALAEVLLRALATDPANRYRDAAEFADALEAFVTASGREDPRLRLANLMQAIFREDRDARRRTMQGALGAPEPAAEVPCEVSNLAVSSSGIRPVAPSQRRRLALIPVLLAGTAAIAGVVMLARLSDSASGVSAKATAVLAAESALRPPALTAVTIEVETVPATHATFSLAGETKSGSRVTFRSARDSIARTLAVHADGFVDAQVRVVADDDKQVSVVLRREEAPPPVTSARTAVRKRVGPAAAARGGAKPMTDLLNKRY